MDPLADRNRSSVRKAPRTSAQRLSVARRARLLEAFLRDDGRRPDLTAAARHLADELVQQLEAPR